MHFKMRFNMHLNMHLKNAFIYMHAKNSFLLEFFKCILKMHVNEF